MQEGSDLLFGTLQCHSAKMERDELSHDCHRFVRKIKMIGKHLVGSRGSPKEILQDVSVFTEDSSYHLYPLRVCFFYRLYLA